MTGTGHEPDKGASELPRGVLTFCMTDIEGSTALWNRDPEEASERQRVQLVSSSAS